MKSTLRSALVISFILLLLPKPGQAQKINQPEGSLRVDLLLPLTTANFTFNRFMDGLIDFSIAYQHNIYEGLYLGVGAHYVYTRIDPLSLGDEVTGGLHFPGAYGKIGFEKFFTNKFGLDFGVKGGYTYVFGTNDTCSAKGEQPFIESMPFIQTQLQLTLMASERSGFSLTLGYSHYFDNFRPEYICYDDFSGYKGSDQAGITQMFSVGFSYAYYFNRN